MGYVQGASDDGVAEVGFMSHLHCPFQGLVPEHSPPWHSASVLQSAKFLHSSIVFCVVTGAFDGGSVVVVVRVLKQ